MPSINFCSHVKWGRSSWRCTALVALTASAWMGSAVAQTTNASGYVRVVGLEPGETASIGGVSLSPGVPILIPAGRAEVELTLRDGSSNTAIVISGDRAIEVVVGTYYSEGAVTKGVLLPGLPQLSEGRYAFGVPLMVAAVGGWTNVLVATVVRSDARAEFDRLRQSYEIATVEADAVRLRQEMEREALSANRATVWRGLSLAVAVGATITSAFDARRQTSRRGARVRYESTGLAVVPTAGTPGVAVYFSF